MIEYLESLLKSAATEVFTTMLNFKVQIEPPQPEAMNGDAHVAGAVGFTGRLNGVVCLHSTADFARHMTSVLLGLPPDEIDADEMINDAVGELTNMLAGHMKSRLLDKGISCAITIPAVVRGREFRIDSVSHAERAAISLRCNQKSMLLMEVLIKPIENAK